jgi:hypothetical protein
LLLRCSLTFIFHCSFNVLWRLFCIAPSVFSDVYFVLLLRCSLTFIFYCSFGVLWRLFFIAPSLFSDVYFVLLLRCSLTFILYCSFGVLWRLFCIAHSVFSYVYLLLLLRCSLTFIFYCSFSVLRRLFFIAPLVFADVYLSPLSIIDNISRFLAIVFSVFNLCCSKWCSRGYHTLQGDNSLKSFECFDQMMFVCRFQASRWSKSQREKLLCD